jgi:hypothetical protein
MARFALHADSVNNAEDAVRGEALPTFFFGDDRNPFDDVLRATRFATTQCLPGRGVCSAMRFSAATAIHDELSGVEDGLIGQTRPALCLDFRPDSRKPSKAAALDALRWRLLRRAQIHGCFVAVVTRIPHREPRFFALHTDEEQSCLRQRPAQSIRPHWIAALVAGRVPSGHCVTAVIRVVAVGARQLIQARLPGIAKRTYQPSRILVHRPRRRAAAEVARLEDRMKLNRVCHASSI